MNGLEHQRILANTISRSVQFHSYKVHSCKVEAWKPFPNLDAYGAGRASGATGYLIAKRGSVLADRKQERHQRPLEESALPISYYLDESDPDVLILRRQDDSFVAAFSAQGATREGLVAAAREDYNSLLERRAEGQEGEADDPSDA
jgi:hypothetical protein